MDVQAFDGWQSRCRNKVRVVTIVVSALRKTRMLRGHSVARHGHPSKRANRSRMTTTGDDKIRGL